MGNIRSLADLIGLIRRRFWLILPIVLIGSLVTLWVALQRPRSFESIAVLQMELPRIAGATPAESLSQSSQRLQLLEQQMRSRDSLLALAERYHIFYDAPDLPAGERLALLRRSITLEPVRVPQQGYTLEPAISAMIIRVVMPEPGLAADIANELAGQVLDSTSDRQSAAVQETLEFYAGEERRLSAEIAALEAEITDYKNEQITALPESLTARRTELSSLEEQMRDYDRQIMDLQQELSPLQALSAPRVVEQRRLTTLEARYAALQTRSDAIANRINELQYSITLTPMVESRLGTYERRLTTLQEQFAVINQRRAEAQTSQRLEQEQQTERFTLLESAVPADYALSSGRRKILALGLLVSGGLALGLAFLMELRNPAVRSARQMEQILQIRPVIALPDLPKPPRRRINRLFGRRAAQP